MNRPMFASACMPGRPDRKGGMRAGGLDQLGDGVAYGLPSCAGDANLEDVSASATSAEAAETALGTLRKG